MAVISLVARLGAQTAEFEKSFAKASTTASQFEKQFGTMASSLASHQARINASFASFSGDKIIRDAAALAAAIERVGGASKLTASEQAAANRTITEAIAKYDALGHSAPQSLRDLAAATKQVVAETAKIETAAPGHFDNLTTQVKAMTLGMVGAQAILGGVGTAFRSLTAFIGSSVESFASAEAAQKKLTAALTSQGTATPAVINQYDKLATQFQRTTQYSDDLTTEMQALLVQVGQVMPSQMEGALKASTDLASGLGIDLRSATLLVAKAFSGGGDELGRLKAILGDAYVAGQGMDGILAAINQKFGGQAQADVESYAGKVKQLANEWDNVKEAVGKAIVTDPALILGLRLIADHVAQAGDAASKATPTFIEYWATFAGVDATTRSVIKLTEQLINLYNTAAHPPAAPDLSKLTSSRPLQFGQDLPDMKKLLDDAAAAVEAQKKAAAAAEAHAKALKELNARFVDAERVLVPLTDAQAKLITHYTNLKLSVSDIAAKMHLGTREVQQYADGVNAMNKVTAESIPLINHMKDALAHSADGMIPTISLMKRAWPTAIEGLDSFSTMTKSEVAVFTKAFADLEKTVTSTTARIGFAMGNAITAAIQGGGNVFAAAAASLGTTLTTDLARHLTAASKEGGQAISGFLGGAINAVLPGIGALLGPLVGKITSSLGDALFKTKGRETNNLRDDFLAQFGVGGTGADSGFGRLAAQLHEIGAEGDALFQRLIRADKADEFRTAMDLVTAALEKQKSAQDQLGDSANTASAAQQAAANALKSRLDELGAEFDSLNKSVSSEAPEEVMGVIEQQQRARMAAIEEEKTALQKQAEEELKTRTETQKRVESETQNSHQRIQDYLDANELEVGYRFKPLNSLPVGGATQDVPALATGGIVRRPTLALVGEKGPEAVVPLSQFGRTGGGGDINVTLMMPDGEVLLRQMVKARRSLGI